MGRHRRGRGPGRRRAIATPSAGTARRSGRCDQCPAVSESRLGQFRCFGAAALDLCAVADGRFDAYVDFDVDALGPWDYLGGMLICQEAGVEVADAFDRPLVTLDHAARRTPVAGVGEAFTALLAARRAESSR